MLRLISIITITVLLFSCKTTTYFIVRHAEKEAATTMSADVALSESGKKRAEALKEELKSEHITHIYSTNYVRTKSTAQPLSTATGVAIEIYDPRDSNFISRLKNMQGKILIVGHSNTVDDIVNKLADKIEISGDLPDSEYGDLFVVKRKGKKIIFEKRQFGGTMYSLRK